MHCTHVCEVYVLSHMYYGGSAAVAAASYDARSRYARISREKTCAQTTIMDSDKANITACNGGFMFAYFLFSAGSLKITINTARHITMQLDLEQGERCTAVHRYTYTNTAMATAIDLPSSNGESFCGAFSFALFSVIYFGAQTFVIVDNSKLLEMMAEIRRWLIFFPSVVCGEAIDAAKR